ncbi:MAG: UvrD-helicase domain-containing protein [Nocardioides sp.]
MTSGGAGVEVRGPADLRRLMNADFELSAQQWAVVSAPLEPAVVIAGAGSGKTSVMAARVVYLVVTGQVRPDQVLRLTFTTKAATELRTRIRSALDAAGFSRDRVDATLGQSGHDVGELLEPVVATYNSYASALLTEHGLRIGHEPTPGHRRRVATLPARRRVIDRHTAPVRLRSDRYVIGYLLALDGALAEHLVTPPKLRALRRAGEPPAASPRR